MRTAGRRKRRLILSLVFVSLCGWTLYLTRQPRASLGGDLSRGWYTDHFSHVSSVRAVLFGKVNVWRRPIADVLPPLSPEDRKALPPDLQKECGECYRLPGEPRGRPLIVAYSHFRRPYPPGDILAFLLPALLYDRGFLGFRAMCHFTIWLMVLYAHLAIAAAALVAADRRPYGFAAVLLLYLEAMHWALEGFYDSLVLVPLLVAAWALSRRNWLTAAVACAIGAFFHFRAAFFMPWAAVAAAGILGERSFFRWRSREWTWAAVAAALGALCMVTFSWAFPGIHALEFHNRAAPGTGGHQILVFIAITAAVVFACLGAWVDALMVVWISFMAARLQQAFPWHFVLVLPWLFYRAAPDRPLRGASADSVRLLVCLLLARCVFDADLAQWIPALG